MKYRLIISVFYSREYDRTLRTQMAEEDITMKKNVFDHSNYAGKLCVDSVADRRADSVVVRRARWLAGRTQAEARGGECGQPARGRGRFPARTFHLVDIENLAAASAPSLGQVREVHDLYAGCLSVGAIDQVVIASSHLTLLHAGLGWPHARYLVRSGPDGADLALLEVLEHENVAARFTRVVIGSGDGIFASAAAILAAAGVWVTVVSLRGHLSRHLELAAREVLFIDGPQPATGAPLQLPLGAA